MILSTTTWAAASDGLIYSAIAVYLLSMVFYAAESAARVSRASTTQHLVSAATAPAASRSAATLTTAAPESARDRPGTRIGAAGTTLAVLGLGLNVVGVAARGLAAERAPWGNMYEFAIVAPVAVGAAYLACLSRQPVRALGAWIVAMIVLILGLAVTVLYTQADALVPVLNSYWLVIHVAAAITAGGIFTLGAVSTVLFLLRSRADRRQPAPGESGVGVLARYSATLPPAATLERVSHYAHMFAFPIWTFAVIAGAIWAENSWGRYWGWDPKETWAFITWVLYAAYLHAQATVGWRGKKASWLALAGYAAFVFNFFGVNIWIPGLHSYAGV